jgi:hypothetical protein
VSPLPFGLFAERRREEEDRRKEGCVEEASILRKQGRPTPRNRENVGGGYSPLGGPDGTEMFPCTRNSNHDPRKRQPVSEVHENGDSQSKVV